MAAPIETIASNTKPAEQAGVSITTKLRVAFVALSLVVVGVALLAVRVSATGAARAKTSDDFKWALNTLREMTLAKVAGLEDAVTFALADPMFRSQVGRTTSLDQSLGLGDRRRDEASRHKAYAGCHQVFVSADLPLFRRYSILAIFNAEGVLLFSKVNPALFGKDESLLPLVKAGLSKGRALEIVAFDNPRFLQAAVLPEPHGNELYLLMSQAIVSGARVLGVVVAGEAISANFLPKLEQASHSIVAVGTPDGSSLLMDHRLPEELGRAVLTRPGFIASDSTVKTIQLGSHSYMALSAPLLGQGEGETIGQATLFRSIDDELGDFLSKVNRGLLVVLGAAVLVSVLGASWIARDLLRPLLALEKGVRTIQGGDLSRLIPVTSRDEVGALARAVNDMILGLREKNFDGLTHVYAKRFLLSALDEMFARSRALSMPLSVLFLDLDHFKNINDSFGHDAGDFVLKEVARILLRHCKRREDVVARYGGEEFAILLGSTSVEKALELAETLRVAVESFEFDYAGERLPVTTSIGVAEIRPSLTEAVDLLKAADKALYASKNAGRNRVSVG